MRFACQPGCTRCCTQQGWVHLSTDDVPRMAKFLGLSAREFRLQYVYATKHRLRLRKPRQGQCPFLGTEGCSIHPVKPVQCRTFPFWPDLVEDKKELKNTAKWCPGLGKGNLISVETLKASALELKKAYPYQY